jgi:hypothetical protein
MSRKLNSAIRVAKVITQSDQFAAVSRKAAAAQSARPSPALVEGDVLDRRADGGAELGCRGLGDGQQRDLRHVRGNGEQFGDIRLVPVEVVARDRRAEPACPQGERETPDRRVDRPGRTRTSTGTRCRTSCTCRPEARVAGLTRSPKRACDASPGSRTCAATAALRPGSRITTYRMPCSTTPAAGACMAMRRQSMMTSGCTGRSRSSLRRTERVVVRSVSASAADGSNGLRLTLAQR